MVSKSIEGKAVTRVPRAVALHTGLALALLVTATCSVGGARAEDHCEKNWGCWDLVYSSKGTVLGASAVGSVVHGGLNGNVSKGGALTSYMMEHFGTKQGFAAHVLVQGAIGGGSMGTEGSARGGLDLGLRLPVTETGGPFLRGGPSAMMLGNHELYFSLLEPLQLRAGYQVLDGDLLLEVAITSGVLAAGRYDPGPDTRRSLARSPELGWYMALRFSQFAVNAEVMHLPAQFNAPG